MSKKKFPYKAYRLMPSLMIREVTVEGYRWGNDPDWLDTTQGVVHWQRLFSTTAEAIAAGEVVLTAAEARQAKTAEGIAKKRRNLEKQKASA